ncbi:MAG: hypothetical protein QXO86_00240 [Nitrososphaerota archaeon]
MARRSELLALSLALILALLFTIFNSPPFAFSTSSAIAQVFNVAPQTEGGIPVKIRVLHQIGDGNPRPPKPGLVFAVIGGSISDLDSKGEAIFNLTPGNYSVIVSWRDGILFPFRTVVTVDKPLLILVLFKEEKLIPDQLVLRVNYTLDSTGTQIKYIPPSNKTVYASTPIISTIDIGGKKRVYPTGETVDEHITPRPYYLSVEPLAGYTLYDVIILVHSSTEIIIPWGVLLVLENETYIPVQITNATIVEGDIEWR